MVRASHKLTLRRFLFLVSKKKDNETRGQLIEVQWFWVEREAKKVLEKNMPWLQIKEESIDQLVSFSPQFV